MFDVTAKGRTPLTGGENTRFDCGEQMVPVLPGPAAALARITAFLFRFLSVCSASAL